VKDLTEGCRRGEAEGWKAIAPNRHLADAEETRETSETREKGEGRVPIFSKSCWGPEGLGKATMTLRAAHKAVVSQDWASQWASDPTGAALRLIDRTPPGPRVARLRTGLPRSLALLLTQLRTDHSHLHAVLHKTGIHPTGLCDCGKPGTRHQFLLACPLHRVARQQLQHNVGADGFDICSLLSNPTIIPFTLRFITSTDRFPRYFANHALPPPSPSTLTESKSQRALRSWVHLMEMVNLKEGEVDVEEEEEEE